MRAVPSGEWKLYRVAIKKVYSGELKDYLIQGMEFEFNGAKLRMNGQEIPAPNIRGMIRKEWIVEVKDESPISEDDPIRKPESLIERSIQAKRRSIQVLPEGWASKHWKHKLQFIDGCEDMALLKNIRRSESRSVKEAAEEKLQILENEEKLQAMGENLDESPPQETTKTVRRGPVPYMDAEAAEELAQAVGAEQTPQGEGTIAGDET